MAYIFLPTSFLSVDIFLQISLFAEFIPAKSKIPLALDLIVLLMKVLFYRILYENLKCSETSYCLVLFALSGWRAFCETL